MSYRINSDYFGHDEHLHVGMRLFPRDTEPKVVSGVSWPNDVPYYFFDSGGGVAHRHLVDAGIFRAGRRHNWERLLQREIWKRNNGSDY